MPVSAFDLLAHTTTTSDAWTIEFASISSAYDDLYMIIEAKSTDGSASGARNLALEFNSDSGSNYQSAATYNGGTTINMTNETSANARLGRVANSYASATAEQWGPAVAWIGSYASTSQYAAWKSSWGGVFQKNSNSNAESGLRWGIWKNTAAISNIKVKFDTGQVKSGSTASLYGLKYS